MTLGATATIVIDVDFAFSEIGVSTDTVVELIGPDGVTVVATNDDNASNADGGFGSLYDSSFRDSYISYDASAGAGAGTYYIRVHEFDSGAGTTFEGGEEFLLDVSVTSHEVGDSVVMGDDTITGGDGDDQLFGVGGNDVIDGGPNNDVIDGGSGGDNLIGGDGDDTLTGGGGFLDRLDGGEGNDSLDAFGSATAALTGGAGNDSLCGGMELSQLQGGAGADELTGVGGVTVVIYSGSDAIFVDLAMNLASGGDADGDVLSNIDGVIGGAFNDTLIGSDADNLIGGSAGNDSLAGGLGADVVDGSSGRDTIDGGGDADLLNGNNEADSLTGGAGADLLEGGAGADTIFAGNDGDLVIGDELIAYATAANLGQPGNNTAATSRDLDGAFLDGESPLVGGDPATPYASLYVAATPGEEEFYSVTVGAGETITIDIDFGNSGIGGLTDTVVELIDVDETTVLAFNDDGTGDEGYGSGAASLRDSFLTFTVAAAGTYYIRVHEFDSGSETVFEGGETFLLNVSVTGHAFNTQLAGADSIAGDAGNDTLFGMGGQDTLSGGAGLDLLVGGSGADSLLGGSLNDTLDGGVGADALNGGGGLDWADYSRAPARVTADLQVAANNSGHAAGDSYVAVENLRGSDARDKLRGDGQANVIEGGGGRDNLVGRSGDDTLIGGLGRDNLTGDTGADQFRLTSSAVADAERIFDFVPGEDKIALSNAAFFLPAGPLDPSRFVQGTQAQDGNDRLIYQQSTGRLWFDSDGDGAIVKLLIATNVNLTALSASDFIVI